MPDDNEAGKSGSEKAPKGDKKAEPRPRSGQITFVTGVHYRKKEKKLASNGLLGSTGSVGATVSPSWGRKRCSASSRPRRTRRSDHRPCRLAASLLRVNAAGPSAGAGLLGRCSFQLVGGRKRRSGAGHGLGAASAVSLASSSLRAPQT